MPEVERIGRYVVERRLGSGAFALVWLGHDELLDAPVAIKVLAENWAHQLDVRARFVEEARVLRRADSDRVVRVFDIGDLPDGRPYFVMTYADRGTLEERLTDGGRLPVAEALRVAEQVARGVAVVHGLGVIHRDLKPSNVLFQSISAGRERLLIADLGLSKAVAHASGFTVAAGSPGYMSPEQKLISGNIDVRADVYGVGAIAHRLLTGVVPQLEGGIMAPATALRDGLPEGTDAVLARALDSDREKRWPSAHALADALVELAGRVPPTVTAEPSDVDSSPETAPGDAAQQPARQDRIMAISQAAVLASLPAGLSTPPASLPQTVPIRSAAVQPPESAARDEPADGPRPRRRRRWPWLIALVVVLGLATGGTAVLLPRAHASTTTVKDRSGAIAVNVPSTWAGQVQNGGWSPKAAGLGSETSAAGLTVASVVADWRDTSKETPGVFIGVSKDAALVDSVSKIRHDGCTVSTEVYSAGSFRGTIYRHACPGPASFAEVALVQQSSGTRVYVQVKQPSAENHTRQILDSLRVTSP